MALFLNKIHAIKLQIRNSMYLQNLQISVFLHLGIKWYEFLNCKSWQINAVGNYSSKNQTTYIRLLN